MDPIQEAYQRGFAAKCAEAGLTAEQAVKLADWSTQLRNFMGRHFQPEEKENLSFGLARYRPMQLNQPAPTEAERNAFAVGRKGKARPKPATPESSVVAKSGSAVKSAARLDVLGRTVLPMAVRGGRVGDTTRMMFAREFGERGTPEASVLAKKIKSVIAWLQNRSRSAGGQVPGHLKSLQALGKNPSLLGQLSKPQ